MLFNVLRSRAWQVRRFAVASSIGVYIGTPGLRWHEDLPLVPATRPNSILAFKKSVEAITPQVLQRTGVEPVMLRIGTVWGPLGLPDSPFFPIPRLISAAMRGEDPDLTPPRPPGFADDGGDRCYVKNCGAGDRLGHAARQASARHVQHLVRAAGRQPRVRECRQSRGPRRRGVAACRPPSGRAARRPVPRSPASPGTPASSRPSTCGPGSPTTSRGSGNPRPEDLTSMSATSDVRRDSGRQRVAAR
jgi:hypothetical protein